MEGVNKTYLFDFFFFSLGLLIAVLNHKMKHWNSSRQCI